VIHQIQENAAADRVFQKIRAVTDPLSPTEANDLARDEVASGAVLGSLALAAALALAFALILISLNAMRAGLLSRFMGILGIIVGVTTVIPLLGPVPIVEVFWVAALGLLFLGKWPQGGPGPAWDAGEAIPWPTAADRQAELVAARAERDAEEGDDEELDGTSRAAATNGRGDDALHARQHPRSRKRKRKRR
jgi:hypothetical protein